MLKTMLDNVRAKTPLIHNITNKIQFFCPVRSPAYSCDKATAPNGINILAFIRNRILNPKFS